MKTKRIIRAMPSTAVAIARSFTPIYSSGAGREDVDWVSKAFDTVEHTVLVESMPKMRSDSIFRIAVDGARLSTT